MSNPDTALGGHHAGMLEASPYAMPSRKLVMWLFIMSDAVTFAALLFAYGYLRNASPDWPKPFHSVTNALVMTFILITSSLTMLIGMKKADAGDKKGALLWVYITASLGVVFAILHIREWLALIDEGLRLFHNPWGSSLFGALFFSITGLHMSHVVGGLIALLVVSAAYKRGSYGAGHIEIWGLYWHFVDLVWMFVVPFVYLMNVSHQ